MRVYSGSVAPDTTNSVDAPLGCAVGNAVETREAIEVLHGRGPADLVECTLVLGAEMLVLGGKGGKTNDLSSARAALGRAIADGSGARTMERMIAAQGGDPRVVGDPSLLALAPEHAVLAEGDGHVAGIDALAIGLAAVAMGAGRTRADQPVDPGVGVVLVAKLGAAVRRGDVLARLHVRGAASASPMVERVRSAFTLADTPPAPTPLVRGRIVA